MMMISGFFKHAESKLPIKVLNNKPVTPVDVFVKYY